MQLPSNTDQTLQDIQKELKELRNIAANNNPHHAKQAVQEATNARDTKALEHELDQLKKIIQMQQTNANTNDNPQDQQPHKRHKAASPKTKDNNNIGPNYVPMIRKYTMLAALVVSQLSQFLIFRNLLSDYVNHYNA